MKHLPLLTLLSNLGLAASLILFAMGQEVAALLTAGAASGLVLPDWRDHTGRWQFVTVLVAAALLATGLLLHQPPAPLLAAGVLAAGLFANLRLMFFRHWTHTRFLELELALYPLPTLCYVLGLVLHAPQPWFLALVPLPLWGLHLVFSFQQLIEGRKLRRTAARGYRVGLNEAAPDFSLMNGEKQPIHLSDYRGKCPVLLLFVRGDWCPHCHMMLRTYQRGSKAFRERGVQLLAVGPDPSGVNLGMCEKLGLDFEMLSDPGQQIADIYGLQINDYDNPFATNYEPTKGIPLPASFLVDEQGLVRYVSRPERVGEFLDPKRVFAVLEQV